MAESYRAEEWKEVTSWGRDCRGKDRVDTSEEVRDRLSGDHARREKQRRREKDGDEVGGEGRAHAFERRFQRSNPELR